MIPGCPDLDQQTTDPALADARVAFIEKMGLLAQNDGMPRIAGRLFAMLVFDGKRYAFGELAEALQVSRASISTSVRLLEDRSVIRRVTQPGDRQDYFELDDAPYETLLRGVVLRAERSRAGIDETISALPPGHDEVRGRLDELAGFYGAIEESLSDIVSRLVASRKLGK